MMRDRCLRAERKRENLNLEMGSKSRLAVAEHRVELCMVGRNSLIELSRVDGWSEKRVVPEI